MSDIVVTSREEIAELLRETLRLELLPVMKEARKVKEYLNDDEVAELLHISPGTLRVWRSESRGPLYKKLGKKVVYARRDIDAWMERNSVRTADSHDIEVLSRRR